MNRQKQINGHSHSKAITTWADRFQQAVGFLAGKMPPHSMCHEIQNDESGEGANAMQIWILNNCHIPVWATAVGIMDAAEVMADNPAEGCGHKMRSE